MARPRIFSFFLSAALACAAACTTFGAGEGESSERDAAPPVPLPDREAGPPGLTDAQPGSDATTDAAPPVAPFCADKRNSAACADFEQPQLLVYSRGAVATLAPSPAGGTALVKDGTLTISPGSAPSTDWWVALPSVGKLVSFQARIVAVTGKSEIVRAQAGDLLRIAMDGPSTLVVTYGTRQAVPVNVALPFVLRITQQGVFIGAREIALFDLGQAKTFSFGMLGDSAQNPLVTFDDVLLLGT